MLLIFWFVAAVLAVYRAARMLALEDGPFTIFAALRDRVGQRTWVGRGLRCPLCIGFWAAALAAWLIGPVSWQEWLLLWGGIAGLQVLVWKWALATGIEIG